MSQPIQIELKVKKTYQSLSGNPFGRSIYKEFAQKKVDECLDFVLSDDERVFEIIIPDYITSYSSSFIQGFFYEIVERIGIPKTKKNFVFIANGITETNEMMMEHLHD